jgi:hypothetical protein
MISLPRKEITKNFLKITSIIITFIYKVPTGQNIYLELTQTECRNVALSRWGNVKSKSESFMSQWNIGHKSSNKRFAAV